MFRRKPYLLRLIASWLLVQTSTQLIWPTLSYALTAGPTAPEATSFEPVDTTDMVNLGSGDLTYNVPLLEVPGPEGGYPLSLSYHGGIQPDMEASWVGLGWTLNPGAINRNVNGYADDQQNASQTVRDYWVGGERKTYKVGVGVGLGDVASVSAGLSFSNDTYRGFAVGEYASVGMGIKGLSNSAGGVGISASVSTDGYGNSSAGLSIGIASHGAVSAGASIGVSTNFNSISANAGVGVSVSAGGDAKGRGKATNSLLGASISTDGGKFSVRGLGGSIGIHNSTAGRIQTQSNGFELNIPIPSTPVFVQLGYDYTRYWSNETSLASVNGSLYYPKIYNSEVDLTNQAFDTYRVSDPAHENIIDNPDPNWVRGGSFPDYDNYMVVAQGLGGSMRPYAFQKALYSRHQQALKDDGKSYTAIKDVPLAWTNNDQPMGFRFEGDYSNAYLQENAPVTGMAYTFGTPKYGNADGNYGYDPTNDHLAGSKHIEYYTNAQLLDANGHSGFVDTDAKGFNRAAAVAARPELSAQIGGFSITNSSGVTYHFALPAYAYEEYSRSESLDDIRTFNELTKNSAYAYTWFLTAVTGPDYVDRNTPGLDASDWGYWVKFSYGMWSDHYRWRNPALGYRSDVDAKIRTYSRGRKEIYYLNSITTRTHTALFEKELRYDGKGTSNKGFAPSDTTAYLKASIYPTLTHEYPANSLRLNRIILLKNADLPSNIESTGYTYDIPAPPIQKKLSGSSTVPYYYEQTICSQFGQNVVDINDVSQLGYDLPGKSIRTVAFSYNYSLAPGTPNSIDNNGLNSGKLTIKSVTFLGVHGMSILPPTQFEYDLSADTKQGDILLVKDPSGSFTTDNIGLIQSIAGSSNSYEPGDILQFQQGSKKKYLTILDVIAGSSPAQYHVRYLSDVANSTITAVTAQVTKNPPYLADYHDWWGMFKSDFNPILTGLAEGIARRTSSVSNKATDVWSLRTITSPLGAKINIAYEGDQYYKPVLNRPDMVCKFQSHNSPDDAASHPGQGYVFLPTLTLGQAKGIFSPGQKILLNGLTSYAKKVNNSYVSAFRPTLGAEVIIQSIVQGAKAYGDRAGLWFTYDTNLNFWSDGAYITLPKTNRINEGGGLRVKSISLTSGGISKTTSYSYNKTFASSLVSLPSGVTSYEPGNILNFARNEFPSSEASNTAGFPTADEVLQLKQAYTQSAINIFAIAREIPAPGVMYETVTVNESLARPSGTQTESPNTATYRFKVFKDNMIGHTVTPTSEGNNRLYASTVSIKDYTSRVGSLVSVTRYGEKGQKLSETVNHFLHDDLDNATYAANSATDATGYQAKLARFNNQGVIQESFADSRDCFASDGNYDHKVVMTKRDVYPTIQTSTTTTDYVTGLSTTSETLGFDFYSGTATRTVATDGYGNRSLTETVPAYRKYPAMGLKLSNASNRQMLSQTASMTTYKVDANNTPLGVLAASAQTWSDQVPVIGLADTNPEQLGKQGGIWRPWQTFNWMPTGTTVDGLTPLMGNNNFIGYDYNSPTQALSWKRTSEVTLYNAYSNALEAKDINNTHLVTKLGFNQSKVFITGGPAAYQELAYSGAEETTKKGGEYFSGGVAVTWGPGSNPAVGDPWGSGNVDISNRYAHTGTSSLRVGPYKHGFSYLLNAAAASQNTFKVNPAQSYRLSVWASNAAGYLYYYVDGQEKAGVKGTIQKRTADGWYLLELTIPPIGTGHTYLRVGCYNTNAGDLSNLTSGISDGSVYFDDFRFQPLSSQATSYVYDALTGQVTDILDNNNLATHYEYDAAGKLRQVKRETFQYGIKPIAKYDYTYALLQPLEMVALQVPAAVTSSRNFLATLMLPSSLIGQCTVSYKAGTASGTLINPATATPTFACTYSTPGVYWVKVQVKDKQNVSRELTQKVTIQ
jgi:hypothetical protein